MANSSWTSGAVPAIDMATVVAAGFVDCEITRCADVFGGAPQASSAARFGNVGISFRARTPVTEEEWLEAVASLACST